MKDVPGCVELTQALIRCPSVTPMDAGALDVLENLLKAHGFVCHRLIFHEPGSEPVENLYARFGFSSPHFCFAGHTDVVPVGNPADWQFDPFSAQLHDGWLYGRGAEDMKGAIACFTVAALEHVRSKPDFQGSISLLITGDEEGDAINGTRQLVPWLVEHGEVPDVCVVGEPTNPDILGEMIKNGRRGSMNFQLTVFGKQGHVAYPHLADNPVTKLVQILHDLKASPLDAGNASFPPSNLEVVTVDVGNPASNVIPAQAYARFNIRFNNLHSSESLAAKVRDVCSRYAGQGYELKIKVTGEAFLTPEGDFTRLVAESVEAATGVKPVLSTTGGTSDARFIKDICPVVEFGTTGRTSHMVDERVMVDDLHTLTRAYAEMLRRYFS